MADGTISAPAGPTLRELGDRCGAAQTGTARAEGPGPSRDSGSEVEQPHRQKFATVKVAPLESTDW